MMCTNAEHTVLSLKKTDALGNKIHEDLKRMAKRLREVKTFKLKMLVDSKWHVLRPQQQHVHQDYDERSKFNHQYNHLQDLEKRLTAGTLTKSQFR